MSSNFANRYVSITPEHTTSTGVRSYGTASAGASAKQFGEVDDESVSPNFDLMTRADISRYGAAKSLNGKEYSEGGLNLVIQSDDFCGMILYGLYGDNTANPPASAGYTYAANVHTWTENKDMILPSFTLEIGREDKEHTYTGMCLSRLSVMGSVGEYATMSVDYNGKAESAVSTLVASPTFAGATLEGLHFAEGTVTFSSDNSTAVASTNIKSISIEWNTNLNTDDACSIGNRTYVRQPEMQMREITGSVEFSRPSIGTALGGSNQDPQYDLITATGGEEYDGTAAGAPAIKLQFNQGSAVGLTVELFKVRWEAPSMNVSGRDSSTMSLNFVALVDDNGQMSKVTFKTGNTSDGRYSGL